MRKSLLVILLAVMAGTSSFGQDRVKNNQSRYMPFLMQLGLSPRINELGNVQFTYDNAVYEVETQSPEHIFSLLHFENAAVITQGKGCFKEFNTAINETMRYYNGSLVFGLEDCKLLGFRWYFDIPGGKNITPHQLFTAIQRIQNGIENTNKELSLAGFF